MYNNLSVSFNNNVFELPKEICTYIELIENSRKLCFQLYDNFVNAVKGNTECFTCEDNVLDNDFEKCALHFIEYLCKNGIYTKTVDYFINDNTGINLFHEIILSARKASLQYMVECKQSLIQAAESNKMPPYFTLMVVV